MYMLFNNIELFTQALGIQEPWKLEEVKFDPLKGQLDINISYKEKSQFPCPHCQKDSSVFDTMERTWRHLNFLGTF